MPDTSHRTRRTRLAKILLSDSFRVHTVEYKDPDGDKVVHRSIEVLEAKAESVQFRVLGGSAGVEHDLRYEMFVRINEVKI